MMKSIIISIEETCRKRCNFKSEQYKSKNLPHTLFDCIEICSFKLLKIRNILLDNENEN